MQYKINNEEFEFITILEDKIHATIFKHFKGNEYKIVLIPKSADDLSDIVVYQKQYDDYGYFTRSASEFFSDVDKDKYPNVSQRKRFMIVKWNWQIIVYVIKFYTHCVKGVC